MIIQMLAAALSIAAHGQADVHASYEVTDYVVSADQMTKLARSPLAPVKGTVVSQVSIRPEGSDATLRVGDIREGKPFLGTRIDVKTDETVILTDTSHGAPVSVNMRVDHDTGATRGTYVVDSHGRREHHVVTVQRRG